MLYRTLLTVTTFGNAFISGDLKDPQTNQTLEYLYQSLKISTPKVLEEFIAYFKFYLSEDKRRLRKLTEIFIDAEKKFDPNSYLKNDSLAMRLLQLAGYKVSPTNIAETHITMISFAIPPKFDEPDNNKLKGLIERAQAEQKLFVNQLQEKNKSLTEIIEIFSVIKDKHNGKKILPFQKSILKIIDNKVDQWESIEIATYLTNLIDDLVNINNMPTCEQAICYLKICKDTMEQFKEIATGFDVTSEIGGVTDNLGSPFIELLEYVEKIQFQITTILNNMGFNLEKAVNFAGDKIRLAGILKIEDQMITQLLSLGISTEVLMTDKSLSLPAEPVAHNAGSINLSEAILLKHKSLRSISVQYAADDSEKNIQESSNIAKEAIARRGSLRKVSPAPAVAAKNAETDSNELFKNFLFRKLSSQLSEPLVVSTSQLNDSGLRVLPPAPSRVGSALVSEAVVEREESAKVTLPAQIAESKLTPR